jgi:DnaJ-class molecular chaperone
MNNLTSTTQAYRELNLREGAGEMEIKSAFRRLAKNCHPDGQGSTDVERFRRAYKAYQQLIKALVGNKSSLESDAPPSDPGRPFVFDDRRQVGLDVYFDLAMVRPLDDSFTIVLPTDAVEACPRCLGQGQTLSRLNPESSVYRPGVCPKCHGTGSIKRRRQISVTVTSEMIARGKFRLRNAGSYLPRQARRGDLIVAFRWVDTLPTGH